MKKVLMSVATAAATVVTTVAATQVQAGTVTSDGADLVLKTKGGFSIKTTDDKYSFGVGGRIQWDYNRAELNGEADENEFSVRRARMAFTGNAGDWSFKTQFNVGEDGADSGDVEDLYIRYNGWGKAAKLSIGRMKEPFGLEELTSSKDISALERSSITELYVPGRNTGFLLSGSNGDFHYGVGVFERDSENKRTADDVAVTGRIALSPLAEAGRVLHFGLGYSSRGETDLIGIEAAGVMGSFHIQSEWQQADIDGFSDELDGYYLQAGWIITGETRPYKGGKFKRVKPQGEAGAVELVVRYEDGDGDFSDIELGLTDGEAYTIGVNWYVNNNVRFGLNYTDGESNTTDNDGEEIRFRTQFVF